MYHGTAHVVLGSGLTIAGRDPVPALHPTALLPDPGHTAGHRDVRRDDGCADPGAGVVDHRLQVRLAGSQAKDQDSGVAANRDGGGPVARVPFWSRRRAVTLVGLLALPSYTTSYDDKRYLPADVEANIGYARCGEALPAGPAQPRGADAGGRPRPSQLHRHAHRQQGRQGRLPPTRHRPGADDHPTAGHTDRRHLASPSSSASRASTRNSASPTAKQRTADLLTQAADINNSIDILRQQLTLQKQSAGAQQEQADVLKQTVAVTERPAGQDRQLRRLLQAHPELLLLRTALLRHPRLLHDPIPLRRAGRNRRADRSARADDGQPRQDQRPATQTARAAASADRQPGDQPRSDPDQLRDAAGSAEPAGQAAVGSHCHRQGLRRLQDRRHVLSAARSLRQPGLQERPQAVRLSRRKGGAVHHLPPG